ncbi:MAG: T9SS type A sorting domain-containing protein [Calditrichia bacterium]
MRHSLLNFRILLLLVVFSFALYGQANFATSLHKERKGKNYWYGADTSVTHAPAPGFESLTNVPISNPNVACLSCHPGDNLDANGDPYPIPYPGANCVDCHATATSPFPGPVTEDDCYGCHSRQKAEKVTLGYADVHRDASTPLECWDCHRKSDLHGDDGISYNSMLEPGAIKADCANSGCHDNLPAGHAANDPHGGALHCSACHTKSVISCYNCHFESQVDAALKRAKQQIHDYVILVNRTSDGKVHTATFQSLSYKGNSWVAFAPYAAHTITKTDARKCADCHLNFGGQVAAIQEYNTNHLIQFATWNSTDSTLSWLHGVVPMPADYQTTFKMDFITYNGDPSDPVAPSKNWSFLKSNWDGHQMFFATPLTKVQMQKLGFDTTLTAIEKNSDVQMPYDFALEQNYPNPFNPGTIIEFELRQSATVTLRVYNILGEEIVTLINNQKMAAGKHQVNFDAGNLSSAIYFYRLESGGLSQIRKMFLMQ